MPRRHISWKIKKSKKGNKVSVSWTTVRDRVGVGDGGVRQTMKDGAYKRSSHLSVSGEDVINWRATKCYLYCARKESRASVTAKLTASCRYPALHLQALAGCTPCSHHAEAVIHSNALRKERTHWHAPRLTGGASGRFFGGGRDSDKSARWYLMDKGFTSNCQMAVSNTGVERRQSSLQRPTSRH